MLRGRIEGLVSPGVPHLAPQQSHGHLREPLPELPSIRYLGNLGLGVLGLSSLEVWQWVCRQEVA